jgi:hypothetical protein
MYKWTDPYCEMEGGRGNVATVGLGLVGVDGINYLSLISLTARQAQFPGRRTEGTIDRIIPYYTPCYHSACSSNGQRQQRQRSHESFIFIFPKHVFLTATAQGCSFCFVSALCTIDVTNLLHM